MNASPDAAAPQPQSRRPLLGRFDPALVTLFIVVFVNMAGFGLVIPLLPSFARALAAPEWLITLMFSAYSLGQFFAEPFWGRLSDRIGRKPVLLITTAANVLGYLALAFTPNIWLAIAVRLFTGLGAGNISTIQGYIADVTPPEQRAGRMGVVGAAFGLGFIVGPGLGGLLTREDMGLIGYQIPLFAAAGLAAAAAIGVLLFLKESRAKADPAAPRPKPFAALGDARADPVISRVLLVSLIYMGAFSGMESTFALWAMDRFGWGVREVGWTFMAVGVVSVISQALIVGRLSRRFGEGRVLMAGVLTFGTSLLLQTFVPRETQWLVPVIAGLGMFGMAMTMPCIGAIISRSTPPDRQGAMLGLNMATGSAARIVGPIAAGAIFSAIGHDWPFRMGFVLCLLAAWAAWNAGRWYRRAQAAQPAAAIAQPAE
jgi:MFS transporter, DHA1 family, tetracycline resistance protein